MQHRESPGAARQPGDDRHRLGTTGVYGDND
jgi:hypothetical protein